MINCYSFTHEALPSLLFVHSKLAYRYFEPLARRVVLGYKKGDPIGLDGISFL